MKFSYSSVNREGSIRGNCSDTPGPAAYTPLLIQNNPKWKLGSESREKSLNKSTTPGAGEYSLPSYIGGGPKYSMLSRGSQSNNIKTKVSPGPGAYTPNYDSINKNISYSMPGRHKDKNQEKIISPGPADYNIRNESSLKVPTYKFGTESRDQIIPKETINKPGPGIYNVSDRANTAPKYSFGSERRGASRGVGTETPGPAEYKPLSYMGKDGPKFTMSARDKRPASKRSFMPGPGQYLINTKNKPSTPSFRMGTAKREGVIGFPKYNPGPAQYMPNNFANSYYKKSEFWTLGSAPRRSNIDYDMGPGPGNYNTGKGLGSGPKYSIVGRGNENKSKILYPGPGQYNNEATITLQKNPAWKMGTSSRENHNV